MNITFRIIYFLLFLFLSGCFLRRQDDYSAHDKEHRELSDINCHQSPKEIAEDISKISKKQKRAYKRLLRKTRKEIARRNKKKIQGKFKE
ncbi:MAG: hypothetical protein V1781_00970 [Bacteroidota bacterium]